MSEWQPIESAPKDGTEILLAVWVTPDGETIPDFVEPAWSVTVAKWEHGSVLRWETTEKSELRHVQEATRIETQGWSPDWIEMGDWEMRWKPMPDLPPPPSPGEEK